MRDECVHIYTKFAVASSQENVQLQQMVHMECEVSVGAEQTLPDRCSVTGHSQLDALLGERTDLGEINFL